MWSDMLDTYVEVLRCGDRVEVRRYVMTVTFGLFAATAAGLSEAHER